MPRRTEDYLAQRRAEVLEAAIRVFSREGFQATTMADFMDTAGFSAGMVYRYFASKQELILACAEELYGIVEPLVASIVARGEPLTPPQAVEELIRGIVDRGEQLGADLARLGVHLWGESFRDEQVATLLHTRVVMLRSCLSSLLTAGHGPTPLDGDADADAFGGFILTTIPGFFVQRLILRDDAVALGDYVKALRSVTGPP